MTKEELIAALEKATGPDRELDADIVRVAFNAGVTWRSTQYTMEVFPAVHWEAPHPYAGMSEPVPAYTASIDAALALVPDGHQSVIWTAGGADVFPATPGLHAYDTTYAATPAIALCIAALRARA